MPNPLFMNYCKWHSTTSGTGAFTIGAAAAADNAGSHDVPANCGATVGNVYRYYAQSVDGTQTEGGRGTYNGTTFARTTVLYNSNGNTSPVNFLTDPIVDMFPNPSESVDGSLAPGNFTVNGWLKVGDGVPGQAGDIGAARITAPTTGALYLGNTNASYLFFNGSAYVLGGTFPLACGSYLMGNANLIYLNEAGTAYLQWNGGTTYTLGSSGTVWTTGNITPVISLRTVAAGDSQMADSSGGGGNADGTEPFGGSAFCASAVGSAVGTGSVYVYGRYRYLQYELSNGSWVTFAAD